MQNMPRPYQSFVVLIKNKTQTAVKIIVLLRIFIQLDVSYVTLAYIFKSDRYNFWKTMYKKHDRSGTSGNLD